MLASGNSHPGGTGAKKIVLDFSAGQQAATFDGLQEYAANHLRYPAQARKAGIEGKVVLLFDISAVGKVTGIQVAQPLGFGCDEAAIEMVQNMPDWKPAMNYGIAVRNKKTVEFSFNLNQ
ncbi:MAG: energy transducer TonB [Lewinellaceae bacterium]|nr:energy transducer TonB [Saprospiraceae bacterium]MCB9337205.1 energy transducer TonB [Lewinellaceae bacterium]